MSGPALLYAASIYMSGKAIRDGLEEGNIAKAVIGGVGAYMSITGLQGMEAGAAGVTRELGTEAATQTADAMTTNAATDAATNTGTEIVAQPAAQTVAPQVVTPPPTQPTGFLDSMGAWAEKNPTLAFGTMNTGGQLLAAYGQGETVDAQLAEQRRIEEQRRQDAEASRERRGTYADTGFLKNYRYDPMTGWSKTNGNA